MNKSNLETKGLIRLMLPLHSKEVRVGIATVGTQRQELMQRPGISTAIWFASCDLLSLLSFTTEDHQPRNSTMNDGLGLLISFTG